ncbi:hypothetical protein [Staphylococcus nepalensis]|uniref:hypothetical protein n=1 Tax=Staphylococcus nepalensis TaxID=214473 RepID=UPI003EE69AC9
MVKIKQKKTMNLPQLIEYIEQTDYEACVYQADDAPVYVRVGRIKGIHIEGSGTVFPHNTFTVEVEEEITEDTVFENLIEILDGSSNCLWERASVKDWKDEDSKEFHAYINGEFKCIWRNGKLVE